MDEQKLYELLKSLYHKLANYIQDEITEENSFQPVYPFPEFSSFDKFKGFNLDVSGNDRAISIQIKSFNDFMVVNISLAYDFLATGVKVLKLHIKPIKIYPICDFNQEEIIGNFRKEFKQLML